MKDRNRTIDILRGIAVLAVLLGHAIQRGLIINYETNFLFKIIYSFHMPLFVVLSGYSLCRYTKKYDKNFILKKFKQLVIPTFIWSYIIYFVRNFNFVGIKDFINFPQSFLAYTKLLLLHPDYVIWFLYTIFICIFIIFIGKLIFKENEKRLTFLMISIAITLFFLPSFITNFFGIYRLKLYFPIFIFGYFLAKYSNKLLPYLKKLFLPSILCYIILFNFYNVSIDSIFVYYGISCFAIVILYNISFYIIRNDTLTKYLTFFSNHSLQIYLLQCICLNIGIATGYIRIFSIFISATTISSLLAYLISKNKTLNSILFGKS